MPKLCKVKNGAIKEPHQPVRDPSSWLLPEYKSLPVDGKFSDDFAVKNRINSSKITLLIKKNMKLASNIKKPRKYIKAKVLTQHV